MSDHRSDLGTNRSADPTAWRARNWGDTEIVVIVGAMAVNLVLLVFTLYTYSFLTAAPKMSH
jgi:hypothetical protein